MRFRWKLGVPVRPPVVIATPAPSDMDEVDVAESGPFRTRRYYWRGVVWLLVALGAQAVAAMMTEEVESVYSQFIYYYIARGLSAINKFLPGIAIGEILFVMLVIWFTSWTLWYMRRSWRRESRFFDVLKVFFLQVLWIMSILFPIFLFLWGLNYQRMPLAEVLGFDRRPALAGELESIGLQIVSGVNSNYELARGTREWVGGSTLPITRDALFRSIERAFQQEQLLGDASQGEFSNPKPLILSRLTSWMGVSGFYIAFTGEVTFNEQVPACELPMVLAHHKAHQRGYAREDEANFVAFLTCTNSTEPYVRYSGYLHGLRIFETMAKGNSELFAELLSRVGDGPRRDLRTRAEFWGGAKSTVMGAVARRVFSGYLRANRVPGGIKNFDEDVPLIIGYYLKYPQRQAPATSPEAPPLEPEPIPPQVEPTPTLEPTPSTLLSPQT
jgi:hypothetical protein